MKNKKKPKVKLKGHRPKPITMRINGVPIRIGVEDYMPQVYLHIGVQGFRLDDYGTKTRARWFAKQLRTAFKIIKKGMVN